MVLHRRVDRTLVANSAPRDTRKVAAHIYRRTFKDGKVPAYDSKLDWAGNYAQMLGVNDSQAFKEVTRLYLMLHADHEGGNVSAHTSHLVGSALSDPYYAWAAGLCWACLK